jgi:hypothetical protein
VPPPPPFNDQGVLPPHLAGPAATYSRSPYVVTLAEFVERFATSEPRRRILRGYLDYRAELHAVGFADGYQWLDGSFVEAVEVTRGRPPNDLDIVTFYGRPAGAATDGSWEAGLSRDRPELFDPRRTKTEFKCDTYYVCQTTDDPRLLVEVATYWYGLFSHRRDAGIWKGMVQVPLEGVDGDREARKILNEKLS